MEKQVSNHKQANLFKATHIMLDEIIESELATWKAPEKKPSKATIIHALVEKHHKKVAKR
jgi:hypothetical protein